MLRISSTADLAHDGPSKLLLYAHHGFGKTYQCRNYLKRYGKGLIISGESGLRSIEDVGIDYVPFSSWDGEVDDLTGAYGFETIRKEIGKPGYLREAGYNWIAIDSLTELSERLIEHLEDVHKGSSNGFAMWGDYSRLMIGALKWVRDLPVHVYVTCLAKEEKDANDMTHFWPHVKGQAVSKQIPALFDHVFCGVRMSKPQEKGPPKIERYFITEEVNGWHGKSRDPRNRLRPWEQSGDVTELLARISQPEETAAEAAQD